MAHYPLIPLIQHDPPEHNQT